MLLAQFHILWPARRALRRGFAIVHAAFRQCCRAAGLATMLMLLPAALPAAAGEHKLLTHWSTPGEMAALAQIQQAVTQKGGALHLVSIPDSVAMRAEFMRKASHGQAPLAVHWYTDGETSHYIEFGAFAPVDRITSTQGWADRLPPIVLERISHAGGIYFVPVGVHVENWLWVNRAVLAANGLPMPGSWADVVAHARVLKARGIEPLVVTGDDWVRTILIRAVLADMIGPPSVANQRPDWEKMASDPRFEQAVRTLVDLNPLLVRSPDKRTWSDGVADLVAGRAAFFVMGDWLKGEMQSLGARVGEEIVCMRPPGNDWLLTVVVDSLAFPPQGDPQQVRAQVQLIEAAMDPAVQVAFARHKGSIPPLMDADAASLDDCARTALSLISDPGTSTYQLEPHAETAVSAVRFWMALDDALWRPGITVEEVMTTVQSIASDVTKGRP